MSITQDLNQQKALQQYQKQLQPEIKQGSFLDGYDNSPENLIKDVEANDTVQSVIRHKEAVRKRLNWLAENLKHRAEIHDNSKLQVPEILWLIQMDREPKYTYGTPEYFEKMNRWQKFFDHHYKENRHHPNHFPNGISDFTLADLCEFVIDITSYYDQLHPENAIQTVEAQANRFELDPQLVQILKNTLLEYYTYLGSIKPISESPESNQS